jgi:pimeloyl-ACP methyl ester carboxylesterase
MGRILIRAGVVIAALLLALVIVGLIYRTWRQHEVAQLLAITTPNGIDEGSFVRIGGIEQYITIRGDDRANPVILIVHGGPGDSMVPFAQIYRPWEKYFTVVQWDQRGSGKTYGRNGRNEAPMTIDRMVRDGIEVAQYLQAHLHKDKMILLAHSFGTVLGIQMVKRRPDLFAAYVGTGQVVAKAEKERILYARLMRKLEAAHDEEGIRKLKTVTAPYNSEAELQVERAVSSRFDPPVERDLRRELTPVVLYAPNYSLRDIYDFTHAPAYAGEAIYRQQLPYDARRLGLKFDLPFFIFEGEADSITPPDLAKAYFDSIQAPVKGFVTFKDVGHSAVLTRPDAFLQELLRRVRPLAVQRN